ncbi:MAG: hypothetical protein L6276_12505 [Acetobacterium sp.]|nr:hypothetical protein [Bacillota bacterium]MCG2731074.1 hypothetical protein [Acetobacterium sp.]
MTSETNQLIYPGTRHKRGITAIVAAVAGELLFSFFLLVGFGEHLWAQVAGGVISVLMVLLFLSGMSLSRSGRGGVEITSEYLIVFRGKQQKILLWTQMEPPAFGGIFQPCVILKAGTVRAVVYNALPGYPLVWSRLSPSQSGLFPSNKTVTIHSNRTQHFGAIAGSTLLLLSAAAMLVIWGSPDGLSPILVGSVATFFVFGAALGVWAMLRIRCRFTLDDGGICCHSWGRVTNIPASAMKDVVLEQARIRDLAVDYRYRGEAMTRAVRYTPMELGLGVRLILADGEWRLDETMTNFPMERLYEEIRSRYQLTGRITMPEMVAASLK